MAHIVGQIEFDCDIEALSEEIEKAGYVKVVRCKDCKHRPGLKYYANGDGYVEGPRCQETLKNGLTITLEDTTCPCVNGLDSYFSYVPKDDWFCADGERRESDE